ncbi:U7 snRNA-associated Sm-like protein LSm11 isoform X2 [Girardinichthys multiradiatus]|uniref:U7 snRNA-associated Sm-like protein LSm11 isoform X2 n=1 Tax=Girardinichthys multiradiatus TaxID=208333 RepID=UPI001FAC73DD|nr:U7 snRNA-associated Sm-like protein LSm11 isoform X2 [Girardinichthys multiradiatus]
MEERERKSVKPDSKQSAVSEPEPIPEAEKLNVCSEKFDPLLALYSPAAPPLPFPNIKCFNNVAEYESFLKGGRGRAKPENVEKRQRKAMKGVADPERIERLKKLMVNNPVSESDVGESSGAAARRSRRRQKPQKNVLTRMSLCKGSPLGELHRCVEGRIRVRVHIRTFKGLRGVCSGFVVAFDKFWNMAMVDVDETYREPLLGEALYHEKALTISRPPQDCNPTSQSAGHHPVCACRPSSSGIQACYSDPVMLCDRPGRALAVCVNPDQSLPLLDGQRHQRPERSPSVLKPGLMS